MGSDGVRWGQMCSNGQDGRRCGEARKLREPKRREQTEQRTSKELKGRRAARAEGKTSGKELLQDCQRTGKF